MEIGHVKNFNTELDDMSLPRQLPSLGQAHVPTGKSWATESIARAALSWIRIVKTISRGCRISENADRAIRLREGSGARPRKHGSETGVIPIRRPGLTASDAEWNYSGLATESPNMPATADGIQRTARVAGHCVSLTNWQSS